VQAVSHYRLPLVVVKAIGCIAAVGETTPTGANHAAARNHDKTAFKIAVLNNVHRSYCEAGGATKR